MAYVSIAYLLNGLEFNMMIWGIFHSIWQPWIWMSNMDNGSALAHHSELTRDLEYV